VPDAKAALGVKSFMAKFMPESVSSVAEVCTALSASNWNETTGASQVNICVLVPTTAETVTATVRFVPDPAGSWHFIAVFEVHSDVEHRPE
jgi:hypothetical protein